MRDGFVKAAAGTPKIRVADCEYNAGQIIALMEEAAAQGVKVLALPELCVTGYTCGDLFLQDTLLRGAEDALGRILEETKELDMLTAVGLPCMSSQRAGYWGWSLKITFPITENFTRHDGSPLEWDWIHR